MPFVLMRRKTGPFGGTGVSEVGGINQRAGCVEHNFHASEGLIGGGDEKRGHKLDRQGVVAEDPCLI